jgi:hypothetical protein
MDCISGIYRTIHTLLEVYEAIWHMAGVFKDTSGFQAGNVKAISFLQYHHRLLCRSLHNYIFVPRYYIDTKGACRFLPF